MAEHSDEMASSTRPMTKEELAQVNTPAFMDGPDRAVWKSVASAEEHTFRGMQTVGSARNDFGRDVGKNVAEEAVKSALTVIRPLEVSLMNLRLKSSTQFEQLVATIEPLSNMDPMFDLQRKRAIGNYFYHGNHCEFLMAMYITQQKEPLLDFRRMSGDGFVMDAFFREVQNLLQEFTITPVEDSGDEEDTFDDYSDDEEDVGKSVTDNIGELLKNGGFLQLQYDKEVVNNWLAKIGKGHIQDKNYLMGLLAHNSRNPQNREIIISQGADDLMTCLKTQLRKTDSAAMIRNAALLTQQVLSEVDVRMDVVKSMFYAMVRWVPGNNNKQTLEVTESREAVAFLSCALRFANQKHKLDISTMQNMAREVFTERQQDPELLTHYVQTARLQAVDPERKADFDFVLKVLQE